MMSPGLTWLHALEAACLSRIGRKSEASQIINEIEQMRRMEYVDAYYLAVTYDALGQRDQAFGELERAREENSINLCLLEVDPRMDPLRHDSRFQRLQRDLFGKTKGLSPSDLLQKSSVRA